MAKVLLCSASSRRRELLAKLVSSFDVTVSGTDEHSRYIRPHLRVMDLAKKKGETVSPRGRIVISSDTLVYCGGIYYGKPADGKDAVRMLKELSGRWHSVYTGVYVATDEEEILFYDRAEVLFRQLSDRDIERYIEEYHPLDKAGAYGVQDGVVVKRCKGSFDTIMGLPTEKLGTILEKMGVKDVY